MHDSVLSTRRLLISATVAAVLASTGSAVAQTNANGANPAAAAAAPAAPVIEKGEMLKRVSYFLGSDAAMRFKEGGIELQHDDFLAGLKDATDGKDPRYTEAEMQSALQAYQTQLRAEDEKKAMEKAKATIEEGAAFLAKNGKRPEVKTTASGLQYEILSVGTGAKPTASSEVSVHYTGTLLDGTVFDSSVQRGQPAEFPVGGVIAGWTEALQLMPQGSKWKLFIPADLAYGNRGAGRDIGPGETLVFEVELLNIK